MEVHSTYSSLSFSKLVEELVFISSEYYKFDESTPLAGDFKTKVQEL
ncbi:12498_t:CDS:2 [Funneliformis geosporum]|uniref:19729_t:CDS:1 n=1 Tax=Funneliformis geosporum TaxID=1117311 RepID=A0A9W4SSA1_9GLOM|nr:19729_t:CDS:2 [Funneliformis geosporum]CAI2179116.1 12498_t:CDS:2 [Funneliformis geosporum]